MTEFFRWLTLTHTQRWHAAHGTSGMGHLYQGRFKSFPIEADEHLMTVLRYVERNPLRAGIVRKAERWRWGSLYRRTIGQETDEAILTDPPVPLGRQWVEHVNRQQTEAELEAIRRCVARGQPFGDDRWQRKVTGHSAWNTPSAPAAAHASGRFRRLNNDSRPL